MLAAAVLDCSLQPDVFWGLTQREFYAIYNRSQRKQLYQEFLLGHATSVLGNVLFPGRKSPSLEAKKIFPRVAELEPPLDLESNDEDLESTLSSFFASL